MYTTSQLTKAAGVTRRLLRHYEGMDLLCPARADNGYRLYSEEDVQVLQQILLFRELGFPLRDVAEIMQSPDYDRPAALLQQAQRLEGRAKQFLILADTARKAALEMKGETVMSTEERFAAFDTVKAMEQYREYEQEAQDRWGQSEAWAISRRRTRSYGKEDWNRMLQEQEKQVHALADAMERGASPSDPEVLALAEQGRKHIDRYFYPCSPETFRQLGEMYFEDERFRAFYERIRPGLAAFYRDAIRMLDK